MTCVLFPLPYFIVCICIKIAYLYKVALNPSSWICCLIIRFTPGFREKIFALDAAALGSLENKDDLRARRIPLELQLLLARMTGVDQVVLFSHLQFVQPMREAHYCIGASYYLVNVLGVFSALFVFIRLSEIFNLKNAIHLGFSENSLGFC